MVFKRTAEEMIAGKEAECERWKKPHEGSGHAAPLPRRGEFLQELRRSHDLRAMMPPQWTQVSAIVGDEVLGV